MNKYFCIVLLLLCICAAASAAQFGVTAGYYGETLAHPGLYVDLSYMVPVSSWYSSGGSVSFLGYHHQRNHTACSYTCEYGEQDPCDQGLRP